MTKEEYFLRLQSFLKANNISAYDYYYTIAHHLRYNNTKLVPAFELVNPFYQPGDLDRLLKCDDERIGQYYARAMAKVMVEYNKTRRIDQAPVQEKPIPKAIRIVPTEGRKETKLTREDISRIISKKLDELPKNITRKDIEEVIDNKFKEVNPKQEAQKQEKEPKQEVKPKYVITSIGERMSADLKGFAIVKEAKAGRINLYYHDPSKTTLSGKRVMPQDALRLDSGYYVNIREYMDKIVDNIITRYPHPERIRFATADDKEVPITAAFEEAYQAAKKAGMIALGREFKQNKVNSFQELLRLEFSSDAVYEGEKMKKGIYVRRDVLDSIFAKYRVKAMINTEERQYTK